MKAVVAHVTPWGVHCGIAKHLSYWLPHVPPDRPMHILGEKPPHYYGEVEDWPGPPVTRCWVRGKGHELGSIRAAAEACGAGIVHWQFDPSFFPHKFMAEYAEWAGALGIKTVTTAHTLEDTQCFTWSNKALLRCVDALIVGTPGMQKAWQDYAARFHIPLRRAVEVIPLPAPPVPPYTGRKLTPGPVVLTWGMLGKGKGHGEVLDAVLLLRAQGHPKARYLVVGQAITGEQRQNVDALRARAAEHPGVLEIREGYLTEDELYGLCQSCHVIALNHQWQHQSSSGTVALSVASGVPVVTSASPMFDGYEGAVLTAQWGPEGWREALEAALVNKQLNRDDIMRRISPETVAGQYEEVYGALDGERQVFTTKDTKNTKDGRLEGETEDKEAVMALEQTQAEIDKARRQALLASAGALLAQAADSDKAEGDRLLEGAEALMKAVRESV